MRDIADTGLNSTYYRGRSTGIYPDARSFSVSRDCEQLFSSGRSGCDYRILPTIFLEHHPGYILCPYRC